VTKKIDSHITFSANLSIIACTFFLVPSFFFFCHCISDSLCLFVSVCVCPLLIFIFFIFLFFFFFFFFFFSLRELVSRQLWCPDKRYCHGSSGSTSPYAPDNKEVSHTCVANKCQTLVSFTSLIHLFIE